MMSSSAPVRRPLISFVNKMTRKAAWVLLGALAWHAPAFADGGPVVSPTLKSMLAGLPLPGAKDQLQQMVGSLKKTPCGGKLTGCFATQSGPLQLYFFTSGTAQQTFLIVVDQKFPLPKLLKANVQQVMGNTQVTAPIISISTTDFALDMSKMPPSLQKVVRDNYFNVSSLAFAKGVQLAARADLGGSIKEAMHALGVRGDQLTMRAAVSIPIPTDFGSAAGSGADAANAVSEGATMKEAGADAVKPEAFVEFQFGPDARLPLVLPPMTLTDATFFLDNSLNFGYKGNAEFRGVENKKVLLEFMTPLTPAGVMDMADFQFLMATPASFTMADAANVMLSMAVPDPRLAKHGGGFIKNIETYKTQLANLAKPLSVIQLRNPNPVPEYRFGDSSKPFPTDLKYFNVALYGPKVSGGPYMTMGGNVTFMGQNLGTATTTADMWGMSQTITRDLNFKLGPLGRVNLSLLEETKATPTLGMVHMKGDLNGQHIDVTASAEKVSINVSASCINPFEIKAEATLTPTINVDDIFNAQAGANVDPSRITGCVGAQLEAALKKISGEYKSLSGYSAKQADAALKAINDKTQKAYNDAKNAARSTANASTNAANSALKATTNAFKGLGKRHHSRTPPDPRMMASVFDWDFYYDAYPDVVASGTDLATHWRDNGFGEGRQGSPTFSTAYYWKRYLDVQKACAKSNSDCIVQHWLNTGIGQGRQGSSSFSLFSYMKRYPDLATNLGQENYTDALDHWLSDGEEAGRNGAPEDSSVGPVAGPVTVGGGGGGFWSDLDKCAGKAVNGFRVRSAGRVDGLQFSYDTLHVVNSMKMGSNGKMTMKTTTDNYYWADAHGYQEGDYKANVKLEAGEYLVRVDYRSGAALDSISFVTNTGKTYGPYGGSGGSPGSYTVTPGERIGCMRGRSGSSIDQLTITSTGAR